MNRRGFTLIELLIVVVIIGALAAFGFPLVRRGMEARRVAGARIAITTMNAKARALAVQRGRLVQFVVAGNEIRLVTRHPVTGAVTVEDRRDLYGVDGVTVGSTRDTLRYDPRGLGLQNSSTTIVVSRPGGFADTVVITSMGGVQQ
ncbi:MAG: prepilin-type N-terminal cleavage/methylation domain-containing protein [Gemmatimonadota bacterium]|nr:prepilin-type N-terminal cleavage/methylation domain-containing protein [Gemmatimonadota bacterium]MDH4349830.1 prepilin-type N-terminal cleavage/methylation domain-containing protein [Gemmatimonadota bacterium]MDH5196384.1 prepilin-type N-terminal cleavage/methylation domain-containing protein [Gemmatimonadota bacterium]